MASKHTIHFNLKGKGIHPDSIGMGELGDLLKLLEAAVKAAVSPEERVAHSEDSDPIVSLVSIREGNSSDMSMAVLDHALPGFLNIVDSISSKNYVKMSVHSHENMYLLSKWAARRRVEIEFEEDGALSMPRLVISRRNPVPSPISSLAQVSGVTTVWGYLVRAGGKKPRAALNFPDGGKVNISADEALTKALGERLHEDVGIEGVATWRLPDWKLIAFKALRLQEYRPRKTDLVQTFKGLSDASAGRWDDVNAAKYVEEIRGADPQ